MAITLVWSSKTWNEPFSMQFSYLSYSKHRMFDFILLWLLPVGLFLLLSDLYLCLTAASTTNCITGLFSIPTLIALLLRPREVNVASEPLILGLLAFIAWAARSP